MGYPDLLIRKLGTVSALSFNTIVVCDNLTALHHEAWDDALENPVSEVEVQAKLTGAECAEVLHRARHLLLEELHDDSALLVALLTFSPNLDVHVDLNMAHVKSRHLAIDIRLSFTILTVHEDLCCSVPDCFILATNSFIHLLFAELPVLADRFVILLQLHSLATVCESLSEIV